MPLAIMHKLDQRELTISLSWNDYDGQKETSFFVDFARNDGTVLGSLKISQAEAEWLSEWLNIKILK